MAAHTDDLRAVSEERTALPPEFAIAPEVLEGAARWQLQRRERVDLVCAFRGHHGRTCGQVVVPVAMDSEAYEYTDEEREGLILAHLMQAHGWTREVPGDGCERQ